MITVVTSCNRAGYDQYGLKAIESLHKYWPLEIELHVVSEDLLNPVPFVGVERRVMLHNLYRESIQANAFHSKYKADLKANGKHPSQFVSQNSQGYNFRFDAYKFSKKVFAIELVAREVKGGRLYWVDADTVTFAPIPMPVLESLLPKKYSISCLDRSSYHSECGFVGYNLDDDLAHLFIRRFMELYSTDEVFKLKEWHDSWVFDYLRRRTSIDTYCIPHTNSSHPFVWSVLGDYMDHMKGNRKHNGVSHDHPRYRRASTEKLGKLVHDDYPMDQVHSGDIPILAPDNLQWTSKAQRIKRARRL